MSHKTNDDVFINYKRIWDEQITNLKLPNFKFKFLYSDNNISDEYVVQGNNLITNCVEDYWVALILKVINGFDYFIQNDFDLVFKTNLSTIINFDKFYEYCCQIDNSREFIYDGTIGDYQNYSYCSGAGMLLNKNSVNLILNNTEHLSESWTDDIFIGFILNKLNKIKPCPSLSRFDIIKENQQFSKENILNNTHIRIKVRIGDFDIKYTNIVYDFLTNK